MDNHVELSTRAQRDLRKIGSGAAREQLIAALRINLLANPMPENANVKRLQGGSLAPTPQR